MADLDAINDGFSRKAAVYDAYCASNAVVTWARGVVRGRVMAAVAPPARILEINAGTGEDAAFLAERGYRVHATDIADGMLAAMRAKRDARGLAAALSVQRLSFTDLDRAQGGAPFDLVFSNFGGLNCADDLGGVARHLPRALTPGGWVVWVVMPRVCPWEMAQTLRGHVRAGLRRWMPGGVVANVEGARIRTRYFAPREVLRALNAGGARFALRDLRAISLFSPPSYLEGFIHRFPRLTARLCALDERAGGWPPWRGWGDFFVLSAQRTA